VKGHAGELHRRPINLTIPVPGQTSFAGGPATSGMIGAGDGSRPDGPGEAPARSEPRCASTA